MTLSMAEAIAVVNQGLSLAADFGDGRLKPHDVAAGLTGAIILIRSRTPPSGVSTCETAMKDRDGWRDLYRAGREEAD